MNLRDLKYLVALADERHFGRAAEKSHVSQPTLSAQIRKLEEYLGVTLVERRPRQVTLTPAGERIVERARRLLHEADAIVDLARTDHDPLSGTLKLALIPTVGPYLLPLVAIRLKGDLPRLKLLLYEYQTATLLEKLRSGEIDLGVLALPASVDGIDSAPLYDEPFRLAVPAEHALAKRDTARVNDLEDQTLLLLEDGHCLRDQALEVCSHVGVHEAQDYRATSLETLRQMVAAGHGVTLLPELATRGHLGKLRGMTLKRFVDPAPTRTIGVVWRRSSTQIAAIQAIVKSVRGAMHTLGVQDRSS